MSVASGREATLLAFDYGEKRIGVALGNSLTRSARPLTVFPTATAITASRPSAS